MSKRPLPEIDPEKPFLSPREAAAFLRCSPSKIVKWRKAGVLPNQREWTRDELLAAAKKKASEPPKPRGKGLKLDLPRPVPKKTTTEGEGGSGRAAAPRANAERKASPPSSSPPVSKPATPAKPGGGLLDALNRALDVLGEDDDEEDVA